MRMILVFCATLISICVGDIGKLNGFGIITLISVMFLAAFLDCRDEIKK